MPKNTRKTEDKPAPVPGILFLLHRLVRFLRERAISRRRQRKSRLIAARKKKPREIIELNKPDDAIYADAVDRLTAAIHARKAIDGHEKAAKALIMPYVRMIVLREWVEQGRKLDNRRVQTPNGSSFILQCKDTLTGTRGFRVPKTEQGDPIDIRQHLASNGVPEALIEKLMIDAEFKEELVIGVNIAKLEKEHRVRQCRNRCRSLIDAAGSGGVTTSDGQKIAFTDDDMEKILTQNNDVTVKEGFLERAVTHCVAVAGDDQEAAADMLIKLLSAVPPQWAIGQALCLHPDEGIVRLLHEEPPAVKAEAKAMPPVNHETPDKKYILRVEGFTITVIRVSDNKEVAKKTCKDAMHATNTIKKWQRDPASLSAFIAENI